MCVRVSVCCDRWLFYGCMPFGHFGEKNENNIKRNCSHVMNLWVFYIFGRLCQRIVHWILQHIYFSLCVGFFLCCSGCSCSSFVHRVEHLIVCAIYCPPKCSLAGKLRHFIDLTANIANGETQNGSQRKGTRNRRKCRNGRDGGRERDGDREREQSKGLQNYKFLAYVKLCVCSKVVKYLWGLYGNCHTFWHV